MQSVRDPERERGVSSGPGVEKTGRLYSYSQSCSTTKRLPNGEGELSTWKGHKSRPMGRNPNQNQNKAQQSQKKKKKDKMMHRMKANQEHCNEAKRTKTKQCSKTCE